MIGRFKSRTEQTLAVDVTGFFGHQPGFPSVGGAWTNTKTGVSGVTDFSVDSFSLQDQGGYPALSMHFSVSGFTVLNSRTVLNRKGTVVGQADNISAQVSGTGDNQGNTTVITGSITAEGIGTETVTICHSDQLDRKAPARGTAVPRKNFAAVAPCRRRHFCAQILSRSPQPAGRGGGIDRVIFVM